MAEGKEFFDTEIASKLRGFHIDDLKLVLGEGAPRFEIVLSHLTCPTPKVLRVTPNVEMNVEGGGQGGVARVVVIGRPALQVNVLDLENKKE